MKTYLDEKDCWISSSGVLGRSFLFKTLDLELEDNLDILLDNFLKALSTKVRLKVSLFERFERKCSFPSERARAIGERGFLTTSGLVHFEHRKKVSVKEVLKANVLKKEDFLIKKLSKIYESMEEGFLNRTQAKPLSPSLFQNLYDLHSPLEVTAYGLRFSKSLLSILKLKNSGNYPLSLKTLAIVLEKIPKPFGFHISIEKISPAQGEKTLKAKSREEAEGRGEVSFRKYQNTQRALSDVALAGEELFHYEIHITLKRLKEDHLRRDIQQTLRSVAPLGEWSIETFGAYPSLFALSPGEELHYRLLEKSSTLKCFLPCFRFGSVLSESEERKASSGQSSLLKGSLLYHRRDFSLDRLNPFSEEYSNHTGVIIGKSGRGKSVFANLLTKSLFHDPLASIFLVDVKGSHRKTVKELGGRIYNIDIKNRSGLNPLKNLTADKDSVEIASGFMEKLFLEEKEDSLPSDEKTDLDKELMKFARRLKSMDREKKTLDNFYNTLDHPRRDKLLRWTRGSLNENIFKAKEDISRQRLLYFNFENISTASNSYIAKAIIAAIMAEFSFKLLNKEPDEKFIFISDETPFFIKSCFNTFSLLSKNVRKLNGSLILLAQNSKDLICNSDTSLIDNSEFKILFSHDGEERKFKETFSLTEEDYRNLKNIRTIKGQFSQFLLKDSLGSRIGFLRLSKEEYILSNTEPLFLHKVQGLRKLLNISEEKALEVMSYV